jgi:hypothetical protein
MLCLPVPTRIFSSFAGLLLGLAACFAPAHAAPKTVCTITINSADEKESLQRHLPPGDYRFVELVQRGKPDWMAAACHSGVTCDSLVISGHFDDGTEFYTDSFDKREFLTMHELQRASCSASCSGVFSKLKDVYLFGCNTLRHQPRHEAAGEVLRSLARAGVPPADAQRVAAQLSQRYGQSNRDRLRHVFPNVPVLYGFASQAPLGRYAGPLMERYFQTAPAGEVGSGLRSATLLALFGPTSMVAESGLSSAEPHATFRQDLCSLADEAPTAAQKLAFLHAFLKRDVTDVRMFLDHLERYAATLDPQQRQQPEVAAALETIARDHPTRERYLGFARDADEAAVQARMLALARRLGWLSLQQEQHEFVQMLATRMQRGSLSRDEVTLACTGQPGAEGGGSVGLAPALRRTDADRAGDVSHAAALACLGDAQGHTRTLKALTSPRDEDVAIAQAYLRHRPLADVGELRAVTTDIGRMSAGSAQVRALETLARLRLADRESLQAVAGLFPQARSLQAQRAIAGILIRADTTLLARADLARTLRQHRLRSPDGNDVIDLLIRLLQAA